MEWQSLMTLYVVCVCYFHKHNIDGVIGGASLFGYLIFKGGMEIVDVKLNELTHTRPHRTIPTTQSFMHFKWCMNVCMYVCVFFVRGAIGPEKSPTGAQDVLS